MKKSKYPTLDLHGYRVDEVFDAIEAFFAKHREAERVRIMTGRGTGKVLTETQRYLHLAGYSYSKEINAAGRPNEGVLVVHMD